MSDLRQKLIDAGLAKYVVPDGLPGHFVGPQPAADVALAVFADWLRADADRRDFHARYRADFPRTKAEQRKDIQEIQVAAALKILAGSIAVAAGSRTTGEDG